jgi:hypothetical protein
MDKFDKSVSLDEKLAPIEKQLKELGFDKSESGWGDSFSLHPSTEQYPIGHYSQSRHYERKPDFVNRIPRLDLRIDFDYEGPEWESLEFKGFSLNMGISSSYGIIRLSQDSGDTMMKYDTRIRPDDLEAAADLDEIVGIVKSRIPMYQQRWKEKDKDGGLLEYEENEKNRR